MKIKIVFEDDDLLVIEKPAGVVVNRAKTVKRETVQDWAEGYLKVLKVEKVPKVSKAFETFDTSDAFGTFCARAGIVHRLDKETSGLLVIAKNAKAFTDLQSQFKARKTRKKYLALVHGEVKPKEGRIEYPIARNPFNREKFGVFPGGRESVTEYRVISNFQFPCPLRVGPARQRVRSQAKSGGKQGGRAISNFTLLEVFPETGRTHQIRVHLKAIGHSVVADKKYAGRKTSRADRLWCPRMFLHASFLGFFHPEKGRGPPKRGAAPSGLCAPRKGLRPSWLCRLGALRPRTGKWVEFKSGLPEDLKKALEELRKAFE